MSSYEYGTSVLREVGRPHRHAHVASRSRPLCGEQLVHQRRALRGSRLRPDHPCGGVGHRAAEPGDALIGLAGVHLDQRVPLRRRRVEPKSTFGSRVIASRQVDRRLHDPDAHGRGTGGVGRMRRAQTTHERSQQRNPAEPDSHPRRDLRQRCRKTFRSSFAGFPRAGRSRAITAAQRRRRSLRIRAPARTPRSVARRWRAARRPTPTPTTIPVSISVTLRSNSPRANRYVAYPNTTPLAPIVYRVRWRDQPRPEPADDDHDHGHAGEPCGAARGR